MKLNKIFALGLATLSLAACSNDKEEVTFNTLPGATVEMGQPEITVKENYGLFNVPIYVSGDRNGCVTVTVAVRETGDNPAVEDGRFYITTKTLNIPANVTEGNIEIATVDISESTAEPDMTCEIYIADVKYATLAGREYTTLTIEDKGIAPLPDQMPTKWAGSAVLKTDDNGNATETADWTSQMSVAEPDSVNEWPFLTFDNFLASEFGGSSSLTIGMDYRYNKAIGWGDFFIPAGYVIGKLNFGSQLGVCDVAIKISGSVERGELKGKWNDDFTAISFAGTSSYLEVLQNGNDVGYWKEFNDMMLRAK